VIAFDGVSSLLQLLRLFAVVRSFHLFQLLLVTAIAFDRVSLLLQLLRLFAVARLFLRFQLLLVKFGELVGLLRVAARGCQLPPIAAATVTVVRVSTSCCERRRTATRCSELRRISARFWKLRRISPLRAFAVLRVIKV
jgi:hypothetical protein